MNWSIYIHELNILFSYKSLYSFGNFIKVILYFLYLTQNIIFIIFIFYLTIITWRWKLNITFLIFFYFLAHHSLRNFFYLYLSPCHRLAIKNYYFFISLFYTFDFILAFLGFKKPIEALLLKNFSWRIIWLRTF